MQNEQQDIEQTEKQSSPEILAKYFKYYKQHTNQSIVYKFNFNRIKYKTTYIKDKKYFDKLYEVLNKYNINKVKFVKFCVFEACIKNPREMATSETFNKFSCYMKIREQYKKIYDYYMKSSKNIAEQCIIENKTPKEYLKELILENKIGYEYVSGRISKYFLASIQNFKQIYLRLDNINKDELSIIYSASDELNQTVQKVFLMYGNKKVHPIQFVEEQINKIKTNNN